MAKKKIIFWSLSDSKSPKEIDYEEGIGSYKLTTIAKENGFDVEVFQGNQFGCDPKVIDKKTREAITEDGIIGISSFSTAKGLLEELAKTESFSHFPLVLGGAGATTTPQQYLKLFKGNNPRALVQGDGELLFDRIIKTHPSKWHEIEGLWTCTPVGSIKQGDFQTLSNLDQSPFTDLSSSYMRKTSRARVDDPSLSLDERIRALRSLQFSHFETRRGCYYHCEFCSEPQLAQKGVRRMTPKRAVNEMKDMHQQFGITFFNFADNIAFDNPEWWHEFSKQLNDSGIAPYVTFGGYGTPKFFALKDWFSQTIPSLAEVGLSFITLGVQSGSKRVLRDIIRRPSDDPENALKVVQMAMPLGVNVKTDFIVGHPTETLEDLQETHEAVRRIYDAGGQVFVRKLGVIPNSGYEIHLGEGRYRLPEWTTDFTRLAERVLGYHSKKDSFRRVSKSYGVVPNLEFIDRQDKIRTPKVSLGVDELVANKEKLKRSNMNPDIKEKYDRLYELTIQSRSS